MKTMIFPVFAFILLSIDSYASVFHVDPKASGWITIDHPMPGVESLMIPADAKGEKGLPASVTVIEDTTASPYRTLDTYVSAAISILKEQGAQVFTVTKDQSQAAGPYVWVLSRRVGQTQVQAVFHKEGFGFYVVSGVAPTEKFQKFAPHFDRIIRTARFQ